MLYGCVKFRICCSFIFTLRCLYLHSVSINAITACRFIKRICATYVLHICYICATYVLHMRYICATYALHMCYICATYVFSLSFLYNIYKKSDLIESVEITNKMQPCNWIYFSNVYWSLTMFWAAHRSSSGALNCICSLWFTYYNKVKDFVYIIHSPY
jgi:hypothetical protein